MWRDRLHSENVSRLLIENDVAPYRAETGGDDADSLAAQEAIIAFGFASVPLVAIYNKKKVDSPILVRGLVKQEDLLSAIQEAVE